MPIPTTVKLFSLLCLFAAASCLPGCGRSMEPEGPQMGELQSYMSEHPELMDTSDEEMDQIEGDEFAEPEE